MSRYLDERDKDEIIVTQIRKHTIKLVQFEQDFGGAEERAKIRVQDA
jgi:hypothetical protein